jgi:hypothetical protein
MALRSPSKPKASQIKNDSSVSAPAGSVAEKLANLITSVNLIGLDVQQKVITVGQTAIFAAHATKHIMGLITPGGLLATGGIQLPTAGFDGQQFVVKSTQAITLVTMTAAGGFTVQGALTTMALNGNAIYIWSAALTTWYRIA